MLLEKVRTLIEPAIMTLGFEFVGCELVKQGRGYLLRVYVDAEHGINVDDCAKVSRQISAILEVEDLFTGSYNLEVSSPGLDRPLFTVAQYQRYVGQRIKLRTRFARDDERRRFTGQLMAVEGNTIQVKLDDDHQLIVFTLDEIEKANLIADI